jgi:hypothetical protein
VSSRNAVDPQPRKPPRYGLLVASPPVDVTGWELWGITWNPEQCGQSGRRSSGCNGNTAALVPFDNPETVNADPFVVYAADDCTALQLRRDWEGRARRQLNATRSFEIANELWEGTLATADGLDNLVLTDAAAGDTLTNGGTDIVTAIACLESGLANCLHGGQGMIHLTPQALAKAASEFVVRREGNLWYSPSDHVVVADAGYTGTGPGGVAAGATQWAYATDMIRVELGEQRTVPDAANLFAYMDLDTNHVTIFAQQWAMYTSDRCCLAAVEISLPVCLIGGAS